MFVCWFAAPWLPHLKLFVLLSQHVFIYQFPINHLILTRRLCCFLIASKLLTFLLTLAVLCAYVTIGDDPKHPPVNTIVLTWEHIYMIIYFKAPLYTMQPLMMISKEPVWPLLKISRVWRIAVSLPCSASLVQSVREESSSSNESLCWMQSKLSRFWVFSTTPRLPAAVLWIIASIGIIMHARTHALYTGCLYEWRFMLYI